MAFPFKKRHFTIMILIYLYHQMIKEVKFFNTGRQAAGVEVLRASS